MALNKTKYLKPNDLYNNVIEYLNNELKIYVNVSTISELRKFKYEKAYVLNDKKELIGLILSNSKHTSTIIFGKFSVRLQYINISSNPNITKIIFNQSMDELVHLDLANNNLKYLKLPEKGFNKLEYFNASKNKFAYGHRITGEYPELFYLNFLYKSTKCEGIND